MPITLVLGGARSGKSRYAQAQAEAAPRGGRLVMIATAEARDADMATRIARHKGDRGPTWTTLEAPRDLAAAVQTLEAADVAVVDCLTLWLSNVLAERRPHTDAAALISALAESPSRVWVVSNEVGLGIVPDNALARVYRDILGSLHQGIAAAASEVVFMVAGLPMKVK